MSFIIKKCFSLPTKLVKHSVQGHHEVWSWHLEDCAPSFHSIWDVSECERALRVAPVDSLTSVVVSRLTPYTSLHKRHSCKRRRPPIHFPELSHFARLLVNDTIIAACLENCVSGLHCTLGLQQSRLEPWTCRGEWHLYSRHCAFLSSVVRV